MLTTFSLGIYFLGKIVPREYIPIISAVGLFFYDKFEETPNEKVVNMSKLTPYLSYILNKIIFISISRNGLLKVIKRDKKEAKCLLKSVHIKCRIMLFTRYWEKKLLPKNVTNQILQRLYYFISILF